MTAALQGHFSDYASFHRTPGNQACHYVGIPFIVFAIVALLAHVPLATFAGWSATLAEIAILGVTLFYLRLDLPLAAMMLVAFAVFDVAGRGVPAITAWGLFIVGWAFQFIGHYVYEKKSPAFYKNLAHLLVGPLWILAKGVGRA
jgi:uncharacterized membrane protein YGL010W